MAILHMRNKNLVKRCLKPILFVILSKVGKLVCKQNLRIWSRAEPGCVRSKQKHITSLSSASDNTAYTLGSIFGRHCMAVHISIMKKNKR